MSYSSMVLYFFCQCLNTSDLSTSIFLGYTEAEKYENVKVEFNQKVVRCSTNTGEITLENTETNERHMVEAGLIVGCDGAYSSVRQSLLKEKTVDFSQLFISSWYLELHMPPTSDGSFAMPPNHLHIWPRGTFMLIALPNQDCSFTCTLFMPLDMFEQLKTRDDVVEFFRRCFPDALDLIGKEHLLQCYFATKPSSLVTVKVHEHMNMIF